MKSEGREYTGIYDAPAAARLLLAGQRTSEVYPVSSRTMLRWIRKGLTTPSLACIPGRELTFSFEDLISIRVVSALRAAGVKWPKIHIAEAWLREKTHYERPFAREEMWTDQSDILTEFKGVLVAASRNGQMAMEIVEEYLIPVSGLSFENHVADSWEPQPFIVLDPEIQFGDPCIKGTRIPARSVWGMVRAGDPKEQVREAYKISPEEMAAALDWGDRIAAAAA
jgi:uncharacterized protein (DUF433 family)